MRKWDVETGKVIEQSEEHSKMVMSLEMSADRTHFVTASQDTSAKLWDPDTLKVSTILHPRARSLTHSLTH